MFVNRTPSSPTGQPDPQELAELQATLLPPALVMLVPETELERRCQEIDIEYPHYREETPVVQQLERDRRARLSAGLHVTGREVQVAHSHTGQFA